MKNCACHVKLPLNGVLLKLSDTKRNISPKRKLLYNIYEMKLYGFQFVDETWNFIEDWIVYAKKEDNV